MPGFDALYKQTVTLFNRKQMSGATYWYVSVLDGVHLIIDRAAIISTYGEQATDNAKLHIRYSPSGEDAVVQTRDGGKVYLKPKAFRAADDVSENITFGFGNEFDFIMAGVYPDEGPICDDDYKSGFFNHMNKTYDDVFAISSVSKFNLIPHFEIAAK